MTTDNPSQKKDRAISPVAVIAIIAVVLLALLIALGVSLATSANRALGLAEEAREAYADASASLEDGDFEKAYASARSAVDSVSALSKEFEGTQWGIAATLPVLGTDAQMAREMGSIAGKLADEVASPVFNQWDSISQTFAAGDWAGDGEQSGSPLVDELSKFTETLAHAEKVVYECEERARNLPESHFSQLNDAAGELKSALSTAGDALRSFDKVAETFSSADRLGDMLGNLDLGSLLDNVDLSGIFNN